ncbi:MAG TPA: alkaline phosphatase family protein [Bryobacteraceae bacterium]|jgi:predicted AlkP superfamily pyrophosphatase or phosphodiesterase|nr:alkaline phosphatase family protein [Bryobacteraceae bacterium]
MNLLRVIFSVAFRATIAALVLQPLVPAQTPKPKLIIGIVVDQFRYDYLTRFRKDYKGGFAKMLANGAVFTNAHYEQMPTVTAVGHSIFFSGAMPAASGIAGNTWFERDSNQVVTSVCDYTVKELGGETRKSGARCDDADPASPRRLEVSTLGDELRNFDEQSKVVGISFKARSAILPSGHRANGAYWFDDASCSFVSSTYYFEKLPEWVKAFNNRKLAAAYAERKWDGFPTWDFHPADPTHPCEKLPASPWGNELIETFSEAAFENEHLGQGASTDILTVSFSSNDYVGHETGPDAPEVHDMAVRTDQLIGKLIAVVEQKVGARNVLFVLTADHGVSPTPNTQEKRNMPGGYISGNPRNVVGEYLNDRFGTRGASGSVKTVAADWVLAFIEPEIYLNWKTIDNAHLNHTDVMRSVRDVLLATRQLHISRVYTRDELIAGGGTDKIARAAANGFNAARSGDVVIVQEPYFLFGRTAGTSHSTPWEYDTHVPVIFYGAGVKAGSYAREVAVNDIAPTLAAMLGVEPPSGSSGRVLPEIVP